MSRTAKQLAADQRRTLRTMRERLLNMASLWDGLDQYAVNRLTELADQVEEVSVDITPDPKDAQA